MENIPVSGKVHIGLNQSKGILFDRDHDLDDVPEEDIKSELESQGVVSVKRVTKKRNDLIELTNTYLLAFGMPTLPTNNKVGLVTAKIHVEVVKLASGVVNSGMTAKAAKTIRCQGA